MPFSPYEFASILSKVQSSKTSGTMVAPATTLTLGGRISTRHAPIGIRPPRTPAVPNLGLAGK